MTCPKASALTTNDDSCAKPVPSVRDTLAFGTVPLGKTGTGEKLKMSLKAEQ